MGKKLTDGELCGEIFNTMEEIAKSGPICKFSVREDLMTDGVTREILVWRKTGYIVENLWPIKPNIEFTIKHIDGFCGTNIRKQLLDTIAALAPDKPFPADGRTRAEAILIVLKMQG